MRSAVRVSLLLGDKGNVGPFAGGQPGGGFFLSRERWRLF
jgi:hypothetical protein